MRPIAHWLLFPLMLVLAACDAQDTRPYPYAPQFVAPSEVPPRLLPIPPVVGSAEYTREIDSILATQKTLTVADKARIMAEDHITPTMIVLPVIGVEYTEDKYPAMYNLLRHAASDAWRDADYAQDYWERQRPWVADERVQLFTKPITRPSYPSGHSTTNFVWAHVLADIFPEKQEALNAQAYAIGMDRVAGGAHFPSDVDAGKRYAAFIYDKMRKIPQFRAELAAAQAEIPAATPVVPAPIYVEDPRNNQPPQLGPAPAVSVPTPPAYKGNLPVDCMHPQPGEQQTKCQ